MRRYYYSIENNSVISYDDIEKEFYEFRQEGEYTDTSFRDYLVNCMYWNNGDLIPVIDRITSLQRKLATLESLSWKYAERPEKGIIVTEPSHLFDDEMEVIKGQIDDLKKYC